MNSLNLNTTSNLVHPQWEALDPTPNIHDLFAKFNTRFFEGRLACVELEWSKRMYQCAGICYSKRNSYSMSCIIRLSEPLLKLRSRKELIETLLHEMIHAFSFIKGIREGNGGHGPVFKGMMERINKLAGTNITVYHTFHDEVNLYKTHWWKCNGPCKDRGPYYGYVKRTCNRAPGKYDFWFAQHQQTCGGTFIKIKEPEPKKKLKKANKENKAAPKDNTRSVTDLFSKVKKPGEGTMTKNYGSSTIVIKKPLDDGVKLPGTPATAIRGNIDGNLKNVRQLKDVDGPTNEIPTKEIEVFRGSGFVLGGGSGRSRLLDRFDKPKPKEGKRSLETGGSRKRRHSPEGKDTIIKLDSTDSDSDSIFNQIDFSVFDKWENEGRQNAIKREICDDTDDIILIDDEYNASLEILSDDNVCDELFSDSDPLLEEFQKRNENKKTKYEVGTDDDLVVCAMCSTQLKREEMADHYNDCGTKFAETSLNMFEIDYDLENMDNDYEIPVNSPMLEPSTSKSQKSGVKVEDKSMPSIYEPKLKKIKVEINKEKIEKAKVKSEIDIASTSKQELGRPSSSKQSYAEKMPVEYQVMKDCGYSEDVIEEYLKNFDNTDHETERDIAEGMCKCPICQKEVNFDQINQHIDLCVQG